MPGSPISFETSSACDAFASFPGHYASVKTPDLHHKRRRLHSSHLGHGNVLLAPTRHLPEAIYLQVQVRLTSSGQPGTPWTSPEGNLGPPESATSTCSAGPFLLPLSHPLLPGLYLSSAFSLLFFISSSQQGSLSPYSLSSLSAR